MARQNQADPTLTHFVLTGRDGTLTLPEGLRKRFGIEENTSLQIIEHDDGFSVKLAKRVPATVAMSFSLDELLGRITDENRHGEWDTGAPSGREVW